MSIFGGQAAAASQSAFGSAPSLFGAPAQSAPSLFGAPAQGSAAAFGAPAQSSASLFGASAQSSSLFGAPAQSSASLFGAPAQSAPVFDAAAQSSASLFGAAQSTSLFGAPAQSSSSLFGAPAQSSASLFGAPAQSSSSLFGAPAQGTSLFGAPAQSSGSLFGSGTQQQQGGLWQSGQAGSGMQQPNASAATVEITGRTRISQLPQNFQTDLFAVERHLRDQRTRGSKLWSKRSNFETEIGQGQARSANITRRLVKLRAALESLKANSDTLKAAVRTERGSAEAVVIALDNLSMSSHSSQVGFLSSGNGLRYPGSEGRMEDRTTHVPEEYFARTLDEVETRALEYKGEIDEIAEYLRAQGVVLSSTSGSIAKGSTRQRAQGPAQVSLLDNISQRRMDIGISGTDDTVASRGKTIEDIIRRQYEYFMVVASHIAGVHENLRSVRERFLQLIRTRDPDVLNPFQQADLREKAEKERQRIIAEKRASEGAMGFGSHSDPAPAVQGSLYQPQGAAGGLGSTSNTFGSGSASNGQATRLFGSAPGAGFGGTLNGSSNGTQARRVSGGRRKRA